MKSRRIQYNERFGCADTYRRMEFRVGNFRVLRRIGAGSFGEVYRGLEVRGAEEVAIKIESDAVTSRQLQNESRICRSLASGVGIPRMRWFSLESDCRAMVTDLLGPSLQTLFNSCDRHFSLKTVLMIADQLLARLEFIHRRNVIHRDIKPGNFLMGVGDHSGLVYVIDFGLSKPYRDMATMEHIPMSMHRSMTGTARYASVNSMRGLEQSRRDDLESLGYSWLYLLRGSLPWQHIHMGSLDERAQRILELKTSISLEDLCSGLPHEFVEYFQIITRLEFEEAPPYAMIRAMFRDLFMRYDYRFDFCYDWVAREPDRKISMAKSLGSVLARELLPPSVSSRRPGLPRLQAKSYGQIGGLFAVAASHSRPVARLTARVPSIRSKSPVK